MPWLNGAGGNISQGVSLFPLLCLLLSPVLSCRGLAESGAFPEPLTVKTYYAGDLPMWEHIVQSGPAMEFTEIPYGAILPHHAITSTAAARFYRGMAAKVNPDTIFILAPNHFERGAGDIITAENVSYDTVFGSLHIDRVLAGKLIASGIVSRDPSPFPEEHAIFFHAPFIRRFFPAARIVPVLIKWDTPGEKLERLGDVLNAIVPPDALVIASVDFSHYNRRDIADFHDTTSFSTISNFDLDNLFSLEIDSPASVFVLETLMSKRGYRKAVRLFHTNSGDFTQVREEESTSHQYFAFYRGEPQIRKTMTILLTGDIRTRNDSLFIREQWLWDRKRDPEKDPPAERYLEHIRGKEDRFFMGADLSVFDLQEDNVVYSCTKNGVTVKLIKYRENMRPDAALQHEVRELATSCDCLIVIYQYDPVSSAALSGDVAREFIDNGAGIFLGRGHSSTTEPEKYKNGVIIRSAGDFITDGSDSAGTIILVDFTPEKISLRMVPVIINKGFPGIF